MKKLFLFILGFLMLTCSAQTIRKLTLEDIFVNRKFSSKGFSGVKPMKSGDTYCQLKGDSINVYDYATGKLVKVVVTSKSLVPEGEKDPIEMGNYEFNETEDAILFATHEEAIYRHSTQSFYYVFDIPKGRLVPLSSSGKQRLATFSPDGKKVAFVRENNIFIKDLATGTEKQITTDGKVNEIINGATDWVYEEEFGFSKAFAWSPDSKRLAYYRFDENRVKEYQLTMYGELYPEIVKYKYPKAGEENSRIELYIFRIDSGTRVKVDIGAETDIYIPGIKWTKDPGKLGVYRLNRLQNKLELMIAEAESGKTRVILTEENKCYVEVNDNLCFLKNNSEFLLTSEKDGFRHIYLYGMDGKLIRQLTSGNWEVTALKGVDEKNGLVLYQSNEGSPLNKDIYSIRFDGTGKMKLSKLVGTNNADFSSDFSYFILKWSDINTPARISVNRESGEEVRVVQENSGLKEQLKKADAGAAEFFSFKTSEGVELNGWMLKPSGFDSLKRYPVLFTVYGGPGSQTVFNAWGAVSMWDRYLAQQGIIIVSVDNRGTGGRGEAFKKITYLQLGKYETADQVEAAKYIGSLPFVDKTRIGMWGWSFGGYMVLSCLTKGADYFSMGVAVAPVTNWKYYDNIYTERFMRTPKENPDGYDSNSPISHVEKLKGKLLILHGMADDNVHPQNSYDFITALIAADKQFEQQFYPNCNHNINSGKNTTIHLYRRMTDFIRLNLLP